MEQKLKWRLDREAPPKTFFQDDNCWKKKKIKEGGERGRGEKGEKRGIKSGVGWEGWRRGEQKKGRRRGKEIINAHEYQNLFKNRFFTIFFNF